MPITWLRGEEKMKVYKWRFKSMKIYANKAVSKAMREKAEEALTELKNCP